MQLKQRSKRLFVPALRALDQSQFACISLVWPNGNRIRRRCGNRASRQWSLLARSVRLVAPVLRNASENIGLARPVQSAIWSSPALIRIAHLT
jgi:hypothetical protein